MTSANVASLRKARAFCSTTIRTSGDCFGTTWHMRYSKTVASREPPRRIFLFPNFTRIYTSLALGFCLGGWPTVWEERNYYKTQNLTWYLNCWQRQVKWWSDMNNDFERTNFVLKGTTLELGIQHSWNFLFSFTLRKKTILVPGLQPHLFKY